jgi:hypothetical protein
MDEVSEPPARREHGAKENLLGLKSRVIEWIN